MPVSVVIPAYNNAELLSQALESVFSQSHRDLEVIVIDDGSTDQTEATCARITDPRFRYLRQRNDGTHGLGARNRGMLEARGEWIALLDQDDLWHPGKIEAQLRLAATRHDAGSIFCWARFIDAKGTEIGRQPRFLPGPNPYADLLAANRFYASTGMFRRELLAVAGLPNESSGYADWSLWLSLARHTRVAVVEDYLADYRVQDQSFQQMQLQSDLGGFALDNWRTLAFHQYRLPADQPECVKAWNAGMRINAKLFINAASNNFRRGQLRLGLRACAQAIRISPAYALRRMLSGLLRGLLAKRAGRP